MKNPNIAVVIMTAGSVMGVCAAFASNDPGAAGRLLSVSDSVMIQRSIQTDNADMGTIVGVGDTILTTGTSKAQWQMSDDSMFAIAPESGFKINKYALPSSKNGQGIAFYTLLQGAVHTISGKIGKSVAANTPRSTYASVQASSNPANLVKSSPRLRARTC